MIKNMSFSKKLLLTVLSIIFLSTLLSTYLIQERSFSSTEDMSKKYIRSLALVNAFKSEQDLSKSIVLSKSFATTLNNILKNDKKYTKDEILDLMKTLVHDNNYVLGIWMDIKEGVFFEKNPEFTNKIGHDSNGRFAPYVYRKLNFINIDNLGPTSDEKEWILGAKKAGKEFVTKPYFTEIENKHILVTAISIPLYENNKFIGAVGIDISLKSIADNISKIKLYNTGYAFLTTDEGIIVGHPKKKLIGKKLSDVTSDKGSLALASKIKDDQTFEYEKVSYGTDKMSYYYMIPFEIGNTGVHWGLTVGVPEEEYLVDAIFIKWFAIIAGVISFLIIAFVIFYNTRILGKNLDSISNGLNSFFAYLNKETQNTTKIQILSNDEFGEMALLINKNVEKIQDSLEKDNDAVNEVINIVNNVENGYLENVITKKANNPDLILLCDNFNNMLASLKNNIGKDLNKINNVLENFSNHNFTSNINNPVGNIEISLNNLGKEISSLLLKSLNTGLTLENASKKLIANVDTLNSSSNEAASSLEETAAALEEITATIISNSENIDNMTDSSDCLTLSANDGLNLAKQTSSAMDDITSQVTLITEAISVIDKIAFQTNILSLNAAVEAATAGEAGKGFAVVAQEVRNLASRSAEAAKEIKDLVQNATAKASFGKDITAEMINGYGELLTNVTAVDEMIKSISASSREQEAGITQINDSITNLDRQTQENANIASQTYEVANQTDELAKQIVEDSQSKEFFGK
ncbi:MAG: methyl-accepting chemotaxis protein [Campylobacteraceae bacterium]|nr:methyl-accepting chemotaxis protein [Campylobacteraceae bacterium]